MTYDELDTVLRIPRNALEGNVWPALPVPKAQTARAILYKMEQTKWRESEVIHQHKFSQLKSLAASASETTQFYLNSLDTADLAPPFDNLEDVWESLPPLPHSNIQGAGYAIHSDFAPEDHSNISDIHTSGATVKAMSGAFRKR